MKKYFFLLSISFILTCSCSTIMNKSKTSINIDTEPASIFFLNNDTLNKYVTPAELLVDRSKNPLELNFLNDSVVKKIKIDSKNSTAYYMNILCNYGLGMLIDKNEPKRYTYPSNIFLDIDDTTNNWQRYRNYRKGDFIFLFSIPYVNSFYINVFNSIKKNTGFWGIAAGIEYFYSNKNSISSQFGYGTDFFCPVPAAVDLEGKYELIRYLYCSLMNNYQLGSFSFGAGLQYSHYFWNLKDEFHPEVNKNYNSKGIGLGFSSYYRVGKIFYIGIIYQPSLIKIKDAVTFQYQHGISIDMMFKISKD